MPINNLLTFPFTSYLMVRLDYVVICGDELEAKIMRIIEMYMEDERKIIYKTLLNDPRNDIDPQATIEITKDVWPAISHRLFKNDLYDQDMAENTLKRAIKSLKKKSFIKVRDTGLKRYESPSYQIDTEVVQAEFEQVKTLGKAGYQKLMVSKIDGIKKPSHQKMTPSEGQNLIPSSTVRVSNFDPNSRRDYEKNTTVEEYEERGNERKILPPVSYQPQTNLPSSIPSIDADVQRIWNFYCQLEQFKRSKPKLDETRANQCKQLSPHVQTLEEMISLYVHAKSILQAQQKDTKLIYLGNLLQPNILNTWQKPGDKPPVNTTPHKHEPTALERANREKKARFEAKLRQEDEARAKAKQLNEVGA